MNRLRLSAAYVAVMLVGMLLFAAAAVFLIDRAQRSTLDTRLRTAARAAAPFMDVSHGRLHIDADDRGQFLEVLGADTDGAVFDLHGRLLLSSAARIPPEVTRERRGGLFDIGRGQSTARAFLQPILYSGKRVGTIVVWHGVDWIAESDRNAAAALGAAALLIAGLALVTGNAVTRSALQDAFARQRRFTSDASHELRAPLAVIRAEADLALRKERDAGEYRSAMRTIASEADHMEAIIGDLLAAARAESGALKRERVSVHDLLARVAERLRAAAAAKEASLRVDGVAGAEILADVNALERALLAVAHNAVRFAPARGTITLRSLCDDRHVQIDVQDDGPGFSPDALEHGVERFWREPGAPDGGGSGLGLAIARALVEANQGTLTLANSPGGGALVRLHFPAI
jgi:signal transduction histidine kinase